MKGNLLLAAILCVTCASPSYAQFDLGRLIQGGTKIIQAATLSDDQIIAYVKEYITDSDAKNKIAPANSKYTQRLNRLTFGLTSVEGIPLNFKVYETNDVNAFACADGSVRVYSGLMDVMTDDELLGVIGHEMGHVAHKDSKNAFKKALMTSALKDGIASTSGTVAALTDSQLGALGEALIQAKYSQKQENNADDYGYDFLKSHGKNPVAMAWSFKKLKELEAAAGATKSNAINQLFSSHPELDKRIERMEKKAKKDGYSLTPTTNNTDNKSSNNNKSAKSSKKSKSSKSKSKKSKK